MSRTDVSIIFSTLLALSILAIVIDAYKGLLPADPANPEKCVYRGDTLQLGVNNRIGLCQQLTCLADGSILVEGCGKLRIENCNHGERINSTQPYPDCCKLRYKCKKPDGSPYYIEKDVSHDVAKAENSA